MNELAFDVCRCNGVREDDRLVAPCETCRRVLEQQPAGERTPWFTEPPLKDGECQYVVPVH
jgi:hypothetical protein